LREGPLEMFACPKRSKEHESLVSVNSDAKTVHTALLAIGAKSGSPVKFNPQFAAASGTPVEITILWTDKDGKQHKQRAQEWIRHVRTKKQLESTWVFAGSSFWFDEETKQQMYQADAGDLVCVSNFPTATLDLPVESSQANADLEFEAFSERIPPLGTKIRLVFQPKLPAAAPQTEKTEKAGK
ncbi:MAG TPA: YdjY domain-containing protein, partial [Pirellulaceae bacterium]|nr:YdjY domain-containing protein [Pirellulaceae bacterium]